MNRGNPSRTVYLGSIPYDQTEQQILDLCQTIGPVTAMKMMFDPTTGKSKGYAFIEFKDLATSASAVRNLNGYQLGSRSLKCGYTTGRGINGSGANSGPGDDEENGPSSMADDVKFPWLPVGVDVNINMTTPAMCISSELSKLQKDQQIELIKVIQNFCKDDKETFVNLLEEAPQLSYAVAELLLSNGVCSVDELTQLAMASKQKTEEPMENNIEDGLDEEKVDLLRQVLQLQDSDIAMLSQEEKMAVWDLKQRAMKGEFGHL